QGRMVEYMQARPQVKSPRGWKPAGRAQSSGRHHGRIEASAHFLGWRGEPMKRCAGWWVLAVTMSGCLAAERPPQMTCGGGINGAHAANVPGVMGPWGQPVPMTGPNAMAAPSDSMARMMMSHSMPLDMAPMGPGGSNIVQAQALAMAGAPSG